MIRITILLLSVIAIFFGLGNCLSPTIKIVGISIYIYWGISILLLLSSIFSGAFIRFVRILELGALFPNYIEGRIDKDKFKKLIKK